MFPPSIMYWALVSWCRIESQVKLEKHVSPRVPLVRNPEISEDNIRMDSQNQTNVDIQRLQPVDNGR